MKWPIGKRNAAIVLVSALVLAACACEKKKSAAEETAPPADHVEPSPQGTSQIVIRKAVSVRTSVAIPFEIPAHAATPHLHGSYKSFVTALGTQSSEHNADVDLLVLTDEQHDDFARTGASDSLFSAQASHDQSVDVSLPPAFDKPRKFYLIFRNTPGGDSKKVVQADLAVDF